MKKIRDKSYCIIYLSFEMKGFVLNCKNIQTIKEK